MTTLTLPLRKTGVLTAGLLLVLLTVYLFLDSAGAQPTPLDFDRDNGGISLPDGFRAVVVAERLGPARHLAVRENGDIYVAMRQRHRGGVSAREGGR